MDQSEITPEERLRDDPTSLEEREKVLLELSEEQELIELGEACRAVGLRTPGDVREAIQQLRKAWEHAQVEANFPDDWRRELRRLMRIIGIGEGE